jgi:hypothetical protein
MEMELKIMKLKYVIVEHDGMDAAMVFSPLLSHQDVAERSKIKSAGFCELDINRRWIIHGGSVSIGCRSRPEDVEILEELL